MARMLQPTKDRLREALRQAADTIEAKDREIAEWKAEVDRLASMLMDNKHLFVIGLVLGVGLTWFAEWVGA